MTDQSIYLIESEKRVVDLKNDPIYLAIINASVACDDLFTRAESHLTTSTDFQLKLEKSSKGFTIAGVEIRLAAAIDFSITASVLGSYGTKIGNPELSSIPKYTKTRLLRGTPLEQLNDCNYILAQIAAHAAGLVDYNINAAYTANLQALATQLEQVSKLPQDVIKQHAIDNKMYGDHEKLVKIFYDKEMDPFMEIYRKTNMEFYLSYVAARRVRHHHLKREPVVPDPETTTGILELLILFKDSMEPAAGVSFVVAALNISETSDAEGEIYIDEIAPGTYQGKLSMEGYQDNDFEFTIVAGETTALQFLMEVVAES